MALADIIDGVATLLVGVTVKLGSERIADTDSPPRVVFVPTADRFGGASARGLAAGTVFSRSLRTRLAGVDVHVWAAGLVSDTSPTKDLRACEALLTQTLWAIHVASGASYQLHGTSWPPAGLGQDGRLCVVHVTFELPVVQADSDQATQSVTLTNVNPTAQNETESMAFPAGDVTRSPAL